MKGFFERLTLVIHWIGFGGSVILVYVLFFKYSNDYPAWVNALIVLAPNTLGWLIKYIVTGNSNFLPFKKNLNHKSLLVELLLQKLNQKTQLAIYQS